MARTTNGAGGASYTLGLLVVFAILFVIAVGLVIVSTTNNAKAEQDRKAAVDKLRQFISQQEINSPEVAELTARTKDTTPGGTLYRKLQDEIEGYKFMIFGTRTASLDAINAELAQLQIDPRNNTFLVGEIKSLRGRLDFSKQAVDDLTKRKQEAEQRAADALAAKTASEQTSLKLVDDLRSNLTDLQKKFVDYQAEIDAHNKDTEQQIQQIRAEAKKSLDESAAQIAQLTQVNDNLREQIRKIGRPGTGRANVATHPELQPKGKIISIIKDDRLVYIDRGRFERIVLGMTFEVYDKVTGVVTDPHDKDNLHGKATIEVVSISEHSSVARIVRSDPVQSIVEGDVIANVVYDPTTVYKFVVFGEFDIDNVGQATVSDRRRIETMITVWGGVLTDTLSYDTDFIVLGKEPVLPDALPAGTVDPDKIAVHAAQLKKYELYQTYAKAAHEQGIPILNQNRFLSLVGYYHR